MNNRVKPEFQEMVFEADVLTHLPRMREMLRDLGGWHTLRLFLLARMGASEDPGPDFFPPAVREAIDIFDQWSQGLNRQPDLFKTSDESERAP